MSITDKTSKDRTPKIAILATVSATVKSFYGGQFKALKDAGFECVVITADDQEFRETENEFRFVPMPFTRILSPLKDFFVLLKLISLFRKEKFDIVQYSTPKAALLGSIASFVARVPNRLYMLWGLYYQDKQGKSRTMFRFIEKVICKFSTQVFPNSYGIRDFVIKDSVAPKEKCQVLHNGGACGVDLKKFDPSKFAAQRTEIRTELGIGEDDVVIGVFGRLAGHKGVNEAVAAFDKISQGNKNAYLLIVGTEEQKDRLQTKTRELIQSHPRIKKLGWQVSLVPYYAVIDIYCLASYREGCPQSPLEAQAMKVPVVLTDIDGSREVIEDGKTGFLTKPKCQESLIASLTELIDAPQLRSDFGQASRERISNMFDQEDMIREIIAHRTGLLM